MLFYHMLRYEVSNIGLTTNFETRHKIQPIQKMNDEDI